MTLTYLRAFVKRFTEKMLSRSCRNRKIGFSWPHENQEKPYVIKEGKRAVETYLEGATAGAEEFGVSGFRLPGVCFVAGPVDLFAASFAFSTLASIALTPV